MRSPGWVASVLVAVLMVEPVALAADVTPQTALPFYETGLVRSKTGIYAGGAGLAIGGGSAIAVVFAGCDADPEHLCQGAWLPDGLAFVGVLTGVIGTGALTAGSLRSRKGLHALGITVTPAPAIVSWFLTFGALGGMAAWIEFAHPTPALPKLVAVRDPFWLGIDLGGLALAYGMGVWEYGLVNSKHHDAKELAPPPDEHAALRIDVVPWVAGDHLGLAAVGRF